MRKLTFFLLIILLATTSVSLFRRTEMFVGYANGQDDPKAERSNKARRAFPTADINEPDSDDSEKGRPKKEKRRRFDAWQFVSSKPEPWIAESVLSPEGYLDFPALPVNESDIILIAIVSSSEAHISGNRKGVFSEFNLAVQSVLKGNQEFTEGSLLTVDRVGGYVKYPNGQRILFRVNGVNMPQVGARYLFFLSTRRKPDFIIKTAYELTPQGVVALDFSDQFLALDGISETEIQKRVRDLLKVTTKEKL
jgi:hypothetical protein